MKKNRRRSHLKVYKPQAPAYPGAADTNYFATRALNILTAVVSGMGFVSTMIFLVTLC